MAKKSLTLLLSVFASWILITGLITYFISVANFNHLVLLCIKDKPELTYVQASFIKTGLIQGNMSQEWQANLHLVLQKVNQGKNTGLYLIILGFALAVLIALKLYDLRNYFILKNHLKLKVYHLIILTLIPLDLGFIKLYIYYHCKIKKTKYLINKRS